MKKLSLVPVLMLALIISTSAFGWSGQWGNVSPFAGGPPNQCPPIAPGSLIQLIHAGPNLAIDDPKESWLALMPDAVAAQAALDAWLLAGTPPIGDDTLVDQTVFADYGPGYEGYFGKPIDGNDGQLGDPWYTRYFTGAEGQIVECDWYGTVGDRDDPNDDIYELVLTGWDGEKYQFGDYTIRIDGECADTHISIPEPATMAIGGIALLLGFFRRKK